MVETALLSVITGALVPRDSTLQSCCPEGPLFPPPTTLVLFPTAQCKLKHLFLSWLVSPVVWQPGMKPCLCCHGVLGSDSAFAPVHLLPHLTRIPLHERLDSCFGPAGEGSAWKTGDCQQENHPRNISSPAKGFAQQLWLLQHQQIWHRGETPDVAE